MRADAVPQKTPQRHRRRESHETVAGQLVVGHPHHVQQVQFAPVLDGPLAAHDEHRKHGKAEEWLDEGEPKTALFLHVPPLPPVPEVAAGQQPVRNQNKGEDRVEMVGGDGEIVQQHGPDAGPDHPAEAEETVGGGHEISLVLLLYLAHQRVHADVQQAHRQARHVKGNAEQNVGRHLHRQAHRRGEGEHGRKRSPAQPQRTVDAGGEGDHREQPRAETEQRNADFELRQRQPVAHLRQVQHPGTDDDIKAGEQPRRGEVAATGKQEQERVHDGGAAGFGGGERRR